MLGEKLKSCRKAHNLTQEAAAEKIGVSAQAVSKWEKGECLPDVYNLKLLSKLFCTSIDSLLDMDGDTEKVVETISVGGAIFEIVQKPETILAGKILYAKDFGTICKALETVDEIQRRQSYEIVSNPILPLRDIVLSVNFWLAEKRRAIGFVRETMTEQQPAGIDIFKMPPSLYIRAYTDQNTARLLARESCEIWELFAYIRNFFMPSHGLKTASCGAQEMEVFDTAEHKTGYAYMPVERA